MEVGLDWERHGCKVDCQNNMELLAFCFTIPHRDSNIYLRRRIYYLRFSLRPTPSIYKYPGFSAWIWNSYQQEWDVAFCSATKVNFRLEISYLRDGRICHRGRVFKYRNGRV